MKRILFVAMFIALALRAAVAADVYASNGAVPPPAQLNAMVVDTLRRFNDALQAKDFTAFHAWLGAPFRDQVSAGQLRSGFQGFIDRRVNLADALTATPTYTQKPTVSPGKIGTVLTLQATCKKRSTVVADLQYYEHGGHWQLVGIHVVVR